MAPPRTLLLALLLTGCGGAPRPDASAPAPSCDAVADHLLLLAEQDNAGAAEPDLAAGIRAEQARQCRDTPWTEARRACLLAARTQDDTVDCPTD